MSSLYVWVAGMDALLLLPREFRIRFRKNLRVRLHWRPVRVTLMRRRDGGEWDVRLEEGTWYGATCRIKEIHLRPYVPSQVL